MFHRDTSSADGHRALQDWVLQTMFRPGLPETFLRYSLRLTGVNGGRLRAGTALSRFWPSTAGADLTGKPNLAEDTGHRTGNSGGSIR
jgi:hypothetical protein